MKHFFFTRAAIETSSVNHLLRRRTNAQTEAALRLWFEASGVFYSCQTVDAHFRVVMRYDEAYGDVINSFQWPPWVILSKLTAAEWAKRHIAPSEEVTLTRLDLDDSYSVDFFEQLMRIPKGRESLTLWTWLRVLDISTGRLTVPLFYRSPMFATLYLPSYDPSHAHLGVAGDHREYHRRSHRIVSGCYALIRLTGMNVSNHINVLGAAAAQTTGPDDRFPGCSVRA